jgi:hypothetical protein
MAVLKGPLRGLLLPLLTASLFCASAGAQPPTEHDIKAVFLYKFTNFVEWPDSTWQGSEPFRLCVLADGPMTAAVERTMHGETINGRPSQTMAPATARDARRCHILFVGHTEMERGASMLAAIRDLPVLTVGEAEGFLSGGGAIEFVREGNRVRFDINVETARRAGLNISARLLQVARHVEGKPR